MELLYLYVNIGAIFIPFIFSFHKKLQFHQKWKAFFSANLISASFFILWDIYFTELGIWGFNPKYLTGVQLWNLPLEEVLFFTCIPYACVFTYHAIKLRIALPPYPKQNLFKLLLFGLVLISIVLLFLFSNQWYTFSTFALLLLLLIYIHLKKIAWFPQFITSYGILLIPFTIVNGILTGTGIEQEVVWYDPKHHLGIRYLSIPIVDVFYGLCLILMNVGLLNISRRHSILKNRTKKKP